MTAVIHHTSFHYYESDIIKIGAVFRIHETDLEGGLLILVILTNYAIYTGIFIFTLYLKKRIEWVDNLQELPSLIPVGLRLEENRKSYAPNDCK